MRAQGQYFSNFLWDPIQMSGGSDWALSALCRTTLRWGEESHGQLYKTPWNKNSPDRQTAAENGKSGEIRRAPNAPCNFTFLPGAERAPVCCRWRVSLEKRRRGDAAAGATLQRICAEHNIHAGAEKHRHQCLPRCRFPLTASFARSRCWSCGGRRSSWKRAAALRYIRNRRSATPT